MTVSRPARNAYIGLTLPPKPTSTPAANDTAGTDSRARSNSTPAPALCSAARGRPKFPGC
jgi:hypothetical protein